MNMSSRVPRIPVHTIHAKFAKEIIQRLHGFQAPAAWTSGFPNFTHIGPGFVDRNMYASQFVMYSIYAKFLTQNLILIDFEDEPSFSKSTLRSIVICLIEFWNDKYISFLI